MGPWDHLTDEEKLENGDYINELRFGGSSETDEEIKERVYREMENDDYDDDHPHDGGE